MKLKLAALSPNARDLVMSSMLYMDSAWDEERGLIGGFSDIPDVDPVSRQVVKDRHSVRGAAWYAQGLLMRRNGDDIARAIRVLGRILDNQFINPETVYYGTFRRYPQEPEPPCEPVMWRDYDPNWRQFIGLSLAQIVDGYADELSPALIARIDAALPRAIEGEMKQGRLVASYTNIALMNAPLAVWCGQRYGRQDFIDYGNTMAEDIYTLFKANDAFLEYNSPTYYGPDLYALAYWRSCGPTERIKQMGAEIEETLWRDIAQYYHAGLRNFCGPYIRSYGMDMTRYVAILGQAIWLVVGRDKAPYPDPALFMGHTGDMEYGACLATVGVRVPEDVQRVLESFPGEHTAEKVIQSEPKATATAWLADEVMIGAADYSGSRNAVGQFHPATMHWRTPDGRIGWMRLVAGVGANARASQGTLEIIASEPGLAFEIYVPGAASLDISASDWNLPGLSAAIEAEGGLEIVPCGLTMNLNYPNVTHFKMTIAR